MPAKSATIKRGRIALNVTIQLLALSTIVILVNYLSFEHYFRWDLSRAGKYGLSGMTKRVVSSLKKEARIYLFFAPNSNRSIAPGLFDDLESLMREYRYASKRKVRIENVDPYRDVGKARELQDKYHFGEKDSLVIIDYDGRQKLIPIVDLADFDSPGLFNRGEARDVVAFRGEQIITSALQQLAEDKAPRFGLVTGHGELDLSDKASVQRFGNLLEHQNIRTISLDLKVLTAVPADVSAVLLLGAKYDFEDRELSLLQKYWQNDGKIFIVLNGRAKTPNLDRFLLSLGVKADQDLIVNSVRTGIQEQSVTLDLWTKFLEATRFLKPLTQVTGFFPGGTRSISMDATVLRRDQVRSTPMLTPAESDRTNYWGETDNFLETNRDPEFHPGSDLQKPLYFGWALEKGSVEDQRIKVRSSARLIIVGNADFISDACLTRAGAAPDLDFLSLSLNWLIDRTQLLAIAPKENNSYTLDLPPGRTERIIFVVLVCLPFSVAVAGTLVWYIRR